MTSNSKKQAQQRTRNQKRYQREAEKARAGNQLAEMRIAQALADQAEARLSLLRYRLDQAVIRSPFDGVVIEGDLQQRIGAPVKKGDALFRIARLDLLYMEAEVNERDIHEVMNKAAGEIAFVTQPRLKFPVKIVRFESAAVPKDGKNIFLVRGAFEQKPENWWRPGMSGICKINVENRTLLWILTHRTIDFLRLFFWW
jgi:multidrug resistance efflux pump